MQDPFVGTWTLNAEKSEFDANHRPTAATMRWESDPEGYRMQAEGECDGRKVAEQPARFILDGQEHPVPNAPGVVAVATRPEPNTVQAEAKLNGRIVGHAQYVVSADGKSLTAITSGMDVQQRTFTMRVVFDRA